MTVKCQEISSQFTLRKNQLSGDKVIMLIFFDVTFFTETKIRKKRFTPKNYVERKISKTKCKDSLIMLISYEVILGMAINKYLISVSCYTTSNRAQILIDLFFLRVILVVATERSVVGLTGGYFFLFECTKPNNQVSKFIPNIIQKFT